MKLLVVDDNDAVREGLRRTIELKTTFDVVGEARDGVDAVRLAMELDVDIILMDVMMPVMDGIEATRIIKKQKPGIYVLALSATADPAAVSAMLNAGASGYILKGALPEQFLSPLEATATGHRVRPIEPLAI